MNSYIDTITNTITAFGYLTISLIIAFLFAILFYAARKRDMSDLYSSDGSGKVSHTKFWANVAYFVSTIAFLKINFDHTQTHLIPEIWLIYLGVVASNASVSKWIAVKGNNNRKRDYIQDE